MYVKVYFKASFARKQDWIFGVLDSENDRFWGVEEAGKKGIHEQVLTTINYIYNRTNY